jgi:anti-sigma regulatory factor (Ser/Thr protein kinase)
VGLNDHGGPNGEAPLSLRAQTFAPSIRLIPKVRHWFQDFLDPLVAGDTYEVASLLLSELASNAVLHAASDFTVCAQIAGHRIRVEVDDLSPELPEVVSPAERTEGGRGLVVVDRLATAWGADRTEAGKRVWFELIVG